MPAMRATRMQKLLLGMGIAALLATAGAAIYVFYVVPRRVDRVIGRVLADARRAGHGAREIRVTTTAPHRLDAAARAGVSVYTSTRDPRDGVSAFGRTWVATGGGVLIYGRAAGAETHERTLTWADGLGTADLTVVARHGTGLAFGGADGSISIVAPETTQAIRFATGVDGAAVTELVSDGEILHVATNGAGLISWDGRRAAAWTAAAGGESLAQLTAMAAGTRGLAVGTADGSVFVQADGRFTRRPLGDAARDTARERVTALAWDGDALWVGTPFGLDRVEADGRTHRVRGDLFVTSLLVDGQGGRVWVGTFDDGLLSLTAAGGGEQRLGGRQRITRLRLVDGRPVAFGARGVFALGGGEAAPLLPAPTASLAGAHVTALLPRNGETWVGTFEDGVDVLGTDGLLAAHLPRRGAPYGADQVNDLSARGRDVLVATVRGVVHISADGAERRIGTAEGLIGEQVQDSAALAGATAYATNRGVTVMGADGIARSLYALQGLPNNHCYAVAWSAGGRLLVGTLGGVAILSPELTVAKTIVAGPGGLRAAWVTALVDTSEGTYVGTYGGGVALIGPSNAVDDVGLAAGGRAIRVNPGALSAAGDRLYAGTLQDGLLVYERSTRRWFAVRAPLELFGSANVTAIAVDGDAIWIGTDRGLVKISKEVLDASLDVFGAHEA